MNILAKLVGSALCLCLLCGGRNAISDNSRNQEGDPKVCGIQMNNMRSYLTRQANAITSSMEDFESLQKWETIRFQRLREFLEMMGVDRYISPPEVNDLHITITGIVRKSGYRIEKLHFQSLPGLYVRCNLYIPDSITKPRPAILYMSGHTPDQKTTYQTHPAKFASLGFVCLLLETIQFGEVRGEHWGPVRNGAFHWYSRGYNPGGVELLNAIRAIDVLCSRQEVDAEKIGVTGISGGGAQSWYVAAADARIKATAPVCGAGTLSDHIVNRTLDSHCDCMFPDNIHLRDFKDIGALIAPRPLLIAQSDQDGIYRIGAVRDLAQQVKTIYRLYGEEENVSLVETPGGHNYHEISRRNIFSFFMKHLMGKDISVEDVGDIDTAASRQSLPGELKIYNGSPPVGDRTVNIQNTFTTRAEKIDVKTKKELALLKQEVIDHLRKKTFHAFPADTIAFDPVVEMCSMNSPRSGNTVYSFNTELGWRLKIDIRWRQDSAAKKPLIIVLRNYNDQRWAAENHTRGLDSSSNYAFIELRGIGETGWESSQQWHMRRAAAWTGRTIASMQVYDLIRCLSFCRSLPQVDPTKVSIAARGGLSVVALYAALLDGRCSAVYVQDPPATQDAADRVDGTNIPTEMLNCLQITDVNQLPALVFPTKAILMGNVPESYKWSQQLIGQLE